MKWRQVRDACLYRSEMGYCMQSLSGILLLVMAQPESFMESDVETLLKTVNGTSIKGTCRVFSLYFIKSCIPHQHFRVCIIINYTYWMLAHARGHREGFMVHIKHHIPGLQHISHSLQFTTCLRK